MIRTLPHVLSTFWLKFLLPYNLNINKLSVLLIIIYIVSDPAYFPGRCAEVLLHNQVIGKIGVIHPNVLNAFDLTNPCSAVEITIEPFL